nr:phosphoenolpyruvate synthase [Neobacillus muris]
MSSLVLGFQEIEKSQHMLIGGKGQNLGKLAKMQGIQVPDGFCVTTTAYQRVIEQNKTFQALLDQLTILKAKDRDQLGEISRKMRQLLMEAEIPSDVEKTITHYLSQFGNHHAYSVRSSATAEDLPYASFAGQHDTYLNIIGKDTILQHIKKCWASLFTERAIIYRIQNRMDHRQVYLSVIVQRMVFPQASGIIFTADPITSSRKLLSIDASFGLGEALVSGMVTADCYKVKENKIVDKRISAKKWAVYGRKEGGTETVPVNQQQQRTQTLTDQQIIQLARIGRQIEAYFGYPQDIEWCLVDDTFYIVQSRPITTLFPIPEANDQENRVYVSVGHQQMMTSPLKPLGLSFHLLITPAPMRKAGGWLYVDVTPMLSSPDSRNRLLTTMEQHDPLMKDALTAVIERGDFIQSLPHDPKAPSQSRNHTDSPEEIEINPAIVHELIQRSQASIEALKQNIQTKSGSDLFDFILEDIKELKKILFDPQSTAVFMSAIHATHWINEKMYEWLGEKNAADTLSQSVPNNITSEMGLALLDVADVIRPYPEVIEFLQQVKDDSFLDELVPFDGGRAAQDAIIDYLNQYGMRCPGEIDITNTRWSEKPLTLVPMILSNIKNFEPDAGKRKFKQGKQEALKKAQELLDRLKPLPEGEQKARDTRRMIDRIRNFIGYREYPKYGMINRYFVYKQALLKEAEQLVHAGLIHEKEDIYYLTFEEFHAAVRTKKLDNEVIHKRKDDYKGYEKLTPPRVITSEGEIMTGTYKREHLPAEAMAGLPVSSGVIEGRARVILHMEEAELEEGDILVTSLYKC